MLLQLDMFQFLELVILTLGASFIFADVINDCNVAGSLDLLEEDKTCNKMLTTTVD